MECGAAGGGGVEIGSGDSMECVLFDWSRCFEIPDDGGFAIGLS